MSETGLFIAGVLVSGVVATGGFLYAMMSFGKWADRTNSEPTAPPE